MKRDLGQPSSPEEAPGMCNIQRAWMAILSIGTPKARCINLIKKASNNFYEHFFLCVKRVGKHTRERLEA